MPPESGERKSDGICLGPTTQKVGHSLVPIMTTEVGARLSFRSRLGMLRLSSVDSPHFSQRLSAQISASTSSHHPSSGLRQIQVAQERDSGTLTKDILVKGAIEPVKDFFGRVLQPSLPSTEGLRRVPAGDRAILSQLSFRHSNFSDGDSRTHSLLSASEPLGNVSRPEGCVFSYAHPSSISEIPTLSGRGRVFSVSGTAVRNLYCPVALYSSGKGGKAHCSSLGHSTFPIPR